MKRREGGTERKGREGKAGKGGFVEGREGGRTEEEKKERREERRGIRGGGGVEEKGRGEGGLMRRPSHHLVELSPDAPRLALVKHGVARRVALMVREGFLPVAELPEKVSLTLSASRASPRGCRPRWGARRGAVQGSPRGGEREGEGE